VIRSLFDGEESFLAVIEGFHPGAVVDGSDIASHGGGVRLVSEGHDAILLVLVPLQEFLDGLLIFKLGVVGVLVEHLQVVALETNAAFERLEGALSVIPDLVVSGLLLLAGDGDATEDVITSIPSLGIEHIESVELVLHSNVHELGVLVVDDTLVAVLDPKKVGRSEL
jgi:hypothetical protein